MKTLAERLAWARAQKSLTQAELGKLAGVSQGTIGNLESGLRTDARRLLHIAAALGVEPMWLAEGMAKEVNGEAAPPPQFDENVSLARLGGRPIPVISAVQAGALKDMETPYSPGAGFAVEYTDDENLSRWAFSLEVEGESMTPDFRPGDRVIIDPDLAPNPGDFVVAKNGGEQATFKKYRPRGMDINGNMVFELVPLNQDYATLRSDIDHLVVIGVMVEHRKRYRRSRS